MPASSFSLNLSFFKCDDYRYEGHYTCDFRMLPRPHYCMGLILEGKGEFFFENKTVTVEKGDIIFVPIGSTYLADYSGEPRVRYLSAHFFFEPDMLFPHGTRPTLQRIRVDGDNSLIADFTAMQEGFSEDAPFQSIAAFYRILHAVHPHIKTEKVAFDSRIARAVDYIEGHYAAALSVPALATHVGMSAPHFYQLFRKAVGKSPLVYKTDVAIRHAELLLMNGEKRSIEEIATEVGFSSAIYFREVFKKKTGLTPTAYRRRPSPETGSDGMV